MYNILLSKMEYGFPLIKNFLKEKLDENKKVVVIPWSFAVELDKEELDNFINEKIRNKYIKPFIEIGIKESNISVLNCYSDTINFMKDKIKDASVLVLTGGNPEMFYNKVLENDLITSLQDFKGIVIGSSAGAELQLKNYFITAKNNYYKIFDWYPGFGMIDDPFYFDVHSINDEEYLQDLKNITIEKEKQVYAIFNDGAIIYNRESNTIELFGNVLTFN